MTPAATRSAVGAALLLAAPLVGAAVAFKPVLALPGLILLITAGLIVTSGRLRVSLSAVAVVGLLAFHTVTELRYSWVAIDYFPGLRVLRAAVGIAMGVILLGPGLPRLLSGPGRLMGLASGLYAAWVIVASQFGGDPRHSTFYGLWLALILLDVNLAIALVDDLEEAWAKFLKGLVILGVVVSAVSLLAGVAGFQLAQSGRLDAAGVPLGYQGLFKNPNILGGQAALTVAAALGLRTLRPRALKPIWIQGAIAVSAFAALASISRAALLSIGIAVTYDFVASTKGQRAVIGRVVLALMLLAGLARTDFAAAALNRLSSTGQDISSGDELRPHIWRSYGRGFLEHPVVGVGFAHSALADDYEARRYTSEVAMAGHSVVLAYGMSTGVPGAVLFSFIVLLGLRNLLRIREARLRQSIVVLLAAMSPLYLATTIALPGSWGPFVFWIPIVFGGVVGARDGRPEAAVGAQLA